MNHFEDLLRKVGGRNKKESICRKRRGVKNLRRRRGRGEVKCRKEEDRRKQEEDAKGRDEEGKEVSEGGSVEEERHK